MNSQVTQNIIARPEALRNAGVLMVFQLNFKKSLPSGYFGTLDKKKGGSPEWTNWHEQDHYCVRVLKWSVKLCPWSTLTSPPFLHLGQTGIKGRKFRNWPFSLRGQRSICPWRNIFKFSHVVSYVKSSHVCEVDSGKFSFINFSKLNSSFSAPFFPAFGGGGWSRDPHLARFSAYSWLPCSGITPSGAQGTCCGTGD